MRNERKAFNRRGRKGFAKVAKKGRKEIREHHCLSRGTSKYISALPEESRTPVK
jgi:hypothetical protein